MKLRIGYGYDVHRLAEGESLWLGGVLIPHYKGTVAHSDGDAWCCQIGRYRPSFS